MIIAALAIVQTKAKLNDIIRTRAANLVKLGFKPFDAAHIASAEAANADVLLTTDDRLVGNAQRYSDSLTVSIQNPVYWLIGVNQNEKEDDNENTY